MFLDILSFEFYCRVFLIHSFTLITLYYFHFVHLETFQMISSAPCVGVSELITDYNE